MNEKQIIILWILNTNKTKQNQSVNEETIIITGNVSIKNVFKWMTLNFVCATKIYPSTKTGCEI